MSGNSFHWSCLPVFRLRPPAKLRPSRFPLKLTGNPRVKDDWYTHPKTGEQIDFIHFARTEGRFSKHFDKDGNPSDVLLAAQQDRLENWNLLQELAGVKD